MFILQLYLQKPALEQIGNIHILILPAANFGEVTTALELTVEGSGFRFKSSFNKIYQSAGAYEYYREVADVQTADMLDLDLPAFGRGKGEYCGGRSLTGM
jgi:hypothetical protein